MSVQCMEVNVWEVRMILLEYGLLINSVYAGFLESAQLNICWQIIIIIIIIIILTRR